MDDLKNISYTITRDENGEELSRTYDNNPNHPHSYVITRDSFGREISKVFGGGVTATASQPPPVVPAPEKNGAEYLGKTIDGFVIRREANGRLTREINYDGLLVVEDLDGRVIRKIDNGNPKSEYSYEVVHYAKGDILSVTYAQNPSNRLSYVITPPDARGTRKTIWGGDTKNKDPNKTAYVPPPPSGYDGPYGPYGRNR